MTTMIDLDAAKRARMLSKLTVRWSKRERALIYTGSKQTGGLLSMFLEEVKMRAMIDAYGLRHGIGARLHTPRASDERSLAAELEARGYDLTTLRFSIQKKVSDGR